MPGHPFWPETWERGYVEWLLPPELSSDPGRLLAHLEGVERLLKRHGIEPSDAHVRRPAQKTRPDRGQLTLEDFV